MIKKIISLVLMLTIVSSIFNITLVTATAATEEKFIYYIMDDGTAIITDYTDTEEKVFIPEKLDNYTVTGIANDTFRDNRDINQVTIPESVTNIDNLTFSHLGDLTINCYQDSYAQTYAEENDIDYTLMAEEISVSSSKEILDVGDSTKLVATIEPKETYNKYSIWSSSNSNVATVDSYGNVNAKSKGKAIIYAKTADGSGKTDMCSVTVRQPVKKITLSHSALKLNKGKSTVIKGNIYPQNADKKKITWSTSNKKIALIQQNGKVTGKSKGTAKIFAKATDGSKTFAVCKVNVLQPVTKIKMSHTRLIMNVGHSRAIKANVFPNNASNKKVKWTSSNKKVAVVYQNGKVTAKTRGNVVIYARAADGSRKYAKCTITIKQPITKIQLSKTDLKIKVGKEKSLTAKVLPKNANNKVVKWSSSNNSVASVSSNGTVLAKKPGKATIYAKAADGSNTKGVCKIAIENAINLTNNEKDILLRSLYREAGSASRLCKIYVCSATLNLWKSKYSNIPLEQMLRNYNIFSTAYTLDSVTEKEKNIVKSAMNEVLAYGTVPGIKYFRTGYYHSFGTPVTNIGNVYFSK